MLDQTITFPVLKKSDDYIRETLTLVYSALKEKGYNPINQIVGYILSEDPTYITNQNNARALMGRINREDLLKTLVKDFIDKH